MNCGVPQNMIGVAVPQQEPLAAPPLCEQSLQRLLLPVGLASSWGMG